MFQPLLYCHIRVRVRVSRITRTKYSPLVFTIVQEQRYIVMAFNWFILHRHWVCEMSCKAHCHELEQMPDLIGISL